LIASAYGLTTANLRALGAHLSRYPESGIRELVRAFEIGEPREGSLFLTLDAFLRSRGLELPVDLTPDGAQELVEEGHLLALVSGTAAAATSRALCRVEWSDGELQRFWKEFNGLEAPLAVEAIREGIRWLADVFAAGVESEWCLVRVG
jgi:hypothetical protein